MSQPFILLVEDNPDDEELTLLSLRKHNLAHDIVVVRDGVEAIEFMTGAGQYSGRDVTAMPTVVLLDLKLPKLDGLGVLKRLRADPRTRRQPVVIRLHQCGQFTQRHRLARDVGDRKLALNVGIEQRLVDPLIDLLGDRVGRR